MTEPRDSKLGTIGWIDLTVEDADRIRDFYAEVAGWRCDPVSMGDYNDYCMMPPSAEQPVAGICHARGVNAKLPPHWLIYITVANLAECLANCERLGGSIVDPPRDMGDYGTLCVIQDPAGAIVALLEPPTRPITPPGT